MFTINVEKETLKNRDFRRVVDTEQHMQLVLMSLLPGEDIGLETHDVDQFFRIEQGRGVAIVDSEVAQLRPGTVVIVPAQALHNIRNTSKTERLQLYTIYCPPHHPRGRRQHLKRQ